MSGRSGTGLTGSQGNALKSKQFYEMFRTQSRVLKAKEAHDEAKTVGEEQRLDKLYTILKEKESGSGKGIAPTPAPASAAPVAPTPTRPTPAPTGGAPKPPTPSPVESGSGKGLALAPPAIAVTEEKKETTNLSLSIPAASAPSKSPAASPRNTKAESEAAKELSELDNLMQLSLKENDELSRKLIEMEIKLKLLENNLPASKMEDLKAGSLRNVDLRPELHPDYVAPTTTTQVASPSDAPASPVAQFDESQKKVVFSKKLNTKEYFEMFKTRSKLIVPAKAGRQPLARAVPIAASDAPAPAVAVAAPAPVAAAPAPAVAPVSAPTVVVAPAPEAAPSAAPAAAPAAAGDATVEEAKAEVAELNDMVENSIQENEELMKELANLRVKLEDAEQRAHKYKHKVSSSKKKLGKKLHLMSAFTAFLESGGKDREKLLEEAPQLKEALGKFDAAHK